MYDDQLFAPGPGAGRGPNQSLSRGPNQSLSRGRMVAIFGGLAVLGLLIGIGAAQLTAGDSDATALIGAEPAVQPTDEQEPIAAPDATDDPTATSTPTPSPTPKPNYRSITENAPAEPDLDFGYLTKVVSEDGTVRLQFDRAQFYTGAAAKKRNKGKAPENDYLIENTNPALRVFGLDPQASIIATNRLLNTPDQVSREALTVEEFVHNSELALSGSDVQLPVWLRHTDGLTGPVTALAEQFLP